jgi:hypothetical protein
VSVVGGAPADVPMDAPADAAGTGLLPAPAKGTPGAAPAPSRPAPMPNFSGAETDGRLVELWLARKAPSTRRKYSEDLGKFSD